jgi:hypothetical protein
MAEKEELKPVAELQVGEYRWFAYSPEQTGLQLVCLEDEKTGITVTTPLANPEKRTAAHKAWGGGRQSRAPGTPWQIYSEMGEKGIDPDHKQDEMFSGYGHESIADASRMQVDHHNTPLHLPFVLFNEGYIIAGQEKSTRFQSGFRNAVLHPLSNYLPEINPDIEAQYQSLGQLSLELFAKQRASLTAAFTEIYQPDLENSRERGALTARGLDCARYFLLFGQNTGFSYETSSRDWSRLIGILRASHVSLYRDYADQLSDFLAPSSGVEESLGFRAEAPSLIRHIEPDTTPNQNLSKLEEFVQTKTDLLQFVPISRGFPQRREQSVELISSEVTAGEKMVMQYLLTIWPGLDAQKLISWVVDQDWDTKAEISDIIFAGHDKYKKLPYFAATTDTTLRISADLGVQRDFNRQRAWSRFMPIPLLYGEKWDSNKADQVLSAGYGTPLYLHNEELHGYMGEFESDMVRVYEAIDGLNDKVSQAFGNEIDYSYIINVLPLGHMVDLYMHGNPKQASYFTDLRYRPGGHINYRALAFDANQLIASSEPYLSGMRLKDKPNPANRKEFFDRS